MSDVLKTTDLMTAKQFQIADGLPAYCELATSKPLVSTRRIGCHANRR